MPLLPTFTPVEGPRWVALGLAAALAAPLRAQEGEAFFQAHCLECHGAARPKAGLSLVDLAHDDPARWGLVLDRLVSGEMPPEDHPQPTAAERREAIAWVEGRLDATEAAPLVRRLTNFEYHNTLRDLLGVELDLTGAPGGTPTASVLHSDPGLFSAQARR